MYRLRCHTIPVGTCIVQETKQASRFFLSNLARASAAHARTIGSRRLGQIIAQVPKVPTYIDIRHSRYMCLYLEHVSA